jgi:hypothetical protein
VPKATAPVSLDAPVKELGLVVGYGGYVQQEWVEDIPGGSVLQIEWHPLPVGSVQQAECPASMLFVPSQKSKQLAGMRDRAPQCLGKVSDRSFVDGYRQCRNSTWDPSGYCSKHLHQVAIKAEQQCNIRASWWAQQAKGGVTSNILDVCAFV